MSDTVQIKELNTVWNRVICDDGIAQEISDAFTFFVPNYKFHPKFRARIWDGKIRLFNNRSRTLYCGLNSKIEEFCKDRGYEIEYLDDFSPNEYSLIEGDKFIKSLNTPLDQRDFQTKTFVDAVRQGRGLILSPTGSGKSALIYFLLRYYNKKTLIVVSQTDHIHQMASNFAKYGYELDVHKIHAGQEKYSDEFVTISTWQSIYKMDEDWFSQFDIFVGDEAHKFKAKMLTGIMENTGLIEHKFGFTGSLDGTLTNSMVLEGLFGSIIVSGTTAEMIDQGYLSPLKIKCIVLKYPDDQRKEVSKLDYQQELEWLFANKRRNTFIKNLALSLKGNTLVLFRYVDKHGIPLYNSIKDEADCPVYYVSGKVPGEEREQIRSIVNEHEKSITVASLGTFSEGVDIPHLHNTIAASPSKGVIRIKQSIGRGLRTADSKEQHTYFDIADDLIWKNRKNFTIRHFQERVLLYNKEEFEYKIYPVNFKG